MAENISIDELADTIARGLQNYNDEVTLKTKAAVEIVGKEVNETIKSHVTFKRHKGDKYVKAFRVKTSYEDQYNKRNTWYVSGKQYRLTHLLENGHALHQGGRTKAYPHIKYGEEIAQKRMVELAEEVINSD